MWWLQFAGGNAAVVAIEVVLGQKMPRRAAAFRIQTGLCRHSNQSLLASGNSAGKEFGKARDRGGIFRDTVRFRAAETALSRVSASKAAEVKGYSDRSRKPELRRTAWWSWQDSNSKQTIMHGDG
jgi:hypothetical protein